MDTPKISVLIPLYNRRPYIEDCINSALTQTFQDFEIIIRDNCSTDGSFEFVAERFSKQISDGKIKLIRNEKNFLLNGSSNRMMMDASGKYIYFLHSDDVLLTHALQHLYEVAEATNADVVHESYFLVSPENVRDQSKWRVSCQEIHQVNQIAIMPNDPAERFKEWSEFGTFHDVQYNLLRRNFMLENEIFFKYDYKFSALWWIMLAKVFVKTPVICYVKRDAPDSGSRNLQSLSKISGWISIFVKMCREMDDLLSRIDFFKDNEEIQYLTKVRLIDCLMGIFIYNAGYYKNGLTPELQQEVSQAFKKHFGDNYFIPLYLFNWQNTFLYQKRVDQLIVPPPPRFRRRQVILDAA